MILSRTGTSGRPKCTVSQADLRTESGLEHGNGKEAERQSERQEQEKDLWAESALQLESVDSECAGICGLRALWRLDSVY